MPDEATSSDRERVLVILAELGALVARNLGGDKGGALRGVAPLAEAQIVLGT